MEDESISVAPFRPVARGPSRPWRVAILTVGPDGGHTQAARAVAERLEAWYPLARVDIQDYLDLVSPALSRGSHFLYVQWVRRWPKGWGYIYEATRDGSASRLAWPEGLGAQRVARWLDTVGPDVAVATHPLAGSALSYLKRRGRLRARIAVVLTDHAVHRQWLAPLVDRYFVHDHALKADLEQRGVPPDRIIASGIPVRAAFERAPDRATARQALGFALTAPVVLMTAGAFGLLPDLTAAVQALRAATPLLQLVVVAGRDRQWYERLAALQDDSGRLQVLAYTTEMPTLMAAADVLVGKAGGMTMAEALVSGLPMVVFRPIPGQEAENARYLKDEGAARIAEDVDTLVTAVRELIVDPALREVMAARARRLGRPGAARTIAVAIADLAREAERRPAMGREG